MSAEDVRGELERLAERCEQATGPDRDLDALIVKALYPEAIIEPYELGDDEPVVFHAEPLVRNKRVLPAYTASLDAAMTLVPAGWNWMAGNRNKPLARAYVNNGELAFVGVALRSNPARLWFEVQAATPALALTAAALRACAAALARSVGETTTVPSALGDTA